jgi:BirA family biotin operon repressor/biotin-[acetyl-CoA-carboxylase] ligase
VSVLLRPTPVDHAHQAVMATALALADAVDAVAGFAPEVKWPNDLVVEDRKLAGVLAEMVDDALVVGAGCNVDWQEFPPEIAATATACNVVTGHAVDRDALLDAFLDQLASELDTVDDVPARYRARLATLGQRVRAELASGAVEGDAVDVTDDGALVVRDDAGTDHTVTAGDVVHLR